MHQEYLQRRPSSCVHKWIKEGNTTIAEISAFLAIAFNMGLIRQPNIEVYWDQANPSQRTPWFPSVMNRDGFQSLLKFLHFSDNTALPPPDDPVAKLFKVQSASTMSTECSLNTINSA